MQWRGHQREVAAVIDDIRGIKKPMNLSVGIDQLIAGLTNWRGKTFARIRKTILEAERGEFARHWIELVHFWEPHHITSGASRNVHHEHRSAAARSQVQHPVSIL